MELGNGLFQVSMRFLVIKSSGYICMDFRVSLFGIKRNITPAWPHSYDGMFLSFMQRKYI